MATSNTVRTRFLVLSDTHDFEFNRGAGPFPLSLPTPAVDVVLHSGDITMAGETYEKFLSMMASIPAELKLVIAGNHDFDLDKSYKDRGFTAADHEAAIAIMKGPLAKEAGVTYLEEGLSSYTLSNGAKFTIYTSPYQPEFYSYAFQYNRDQDRFNPEGEQAEAGIKCIAENPVPNFPGCQIMMTHGPPMSVLDRTVTMRGGHEVGCVSLMAAAARAKPLLYCFGHIHEGHGQQLVTWKEGDRSSMSVTEDSIQKRVDNENAFPDPSNSPVAWGKETLMVNSSIMDVTYRPTNKPWVVDLDLPVAITSGAQD